MALESVKKAFEMFFEKIDDKDSGVAYLRDALESACEFIENGGSKHEGDIIANLVRTYRISVMEKVRNEIGSGTPDSKQLEYLDGLMRQFVDFNFAADDSNFQALKAEVSSRHLDQIFVELRGKRLSEFTSTDKAWLKSLYEEVINEMGGSNP